MPAKSSGGICVLFFLYFSSVNSACFKASSGFFMFAHSLTPNIPNT
nr:MAG TPA: hypothetical protein [Caudoviricetes sp.]DAT85493.1 MAG TPA: hypothetical protein [Bacteriophage sp.]